MKLVFFILLLANGVVWLVLQSARTPGIEPERIAAQLHQERLTVIKEPQPVPAAPVPEDTTEAAPATAAAACIDIGDFNTRSAATFEAEFARLSQGALPTKRLVRAPPQHIVYLPPQAGEAAASRRLAQLRDMGFTDSAVIREEPTRRWGISLGLFSRVELAEAQQQKLREAGVTDARIGEFPVNSARYAYRITGLDEAATGRLVALASGLAGIRLRNCH